MTETVISWHCWFLLCLLCDNAALRTAPGGARTGRAAICGKSPRSQQVSRSDGAGLTQRWHRSACSGLGNCSLSSSACFGLVMALRDGNHDPGIYTSVLVESDFAVCFICSSCVINSNAELNTVQFTCFCKIYTVLALIVVFPCLVQTHAERNAQNWSPS